DQRFDLVSPGEHHRLSHRSPFAPVVSLAFVLVVMAARAVAVPHEQGYGVAARQVGPRGRVAADHDVLGPVDPLDLPDPQAGSGAGSGMGSVDGPGVASIAAKASAEAGRSAGSLARACSVAAASEAGTSGASCRTGIGGSLMWAAATATGLSPVKGGRPVSI